MCCIATDKADDEKAWRNNNSIAKFLQVLAKKGGNLGMVDNRGDSAVYWAARQGHHDVVQYLISQGVHVNQQNKVSQILSVI